jgi:hypothetical protein
MGPVEKSPEYRARITDRKTGETAVTTVTASEFWWTEGNGSCDCNRFLDLRRALGEDPDVSLARCVDPDFPDGRYTLELVPTSSSHSS